VTVEIILAYKASAAALPAQTPARRRRSAALAEAL